MPAPTLPNWTARPVPHRKTLKGRYVRVEPLEAERHCDDLYAAFANANERWTYRFQEGFDTREDLFEYLSGIESGTAAYYGVYIDLATNKAGGLGSLMTIDKVNGTTEIGAIMLS